MLIPNHPDPERLSALASGDTDATADAALSDHVSTCDHCSVLVEELGALRMSLAELPDLRPHRPLRLLPEAAGEPSRVDRMGGWARRIFAPVLTAGAALAMVGLIGTAVPALDNLSLGAGDAETEAAREIDMDAEPSTMAGEPDTAAFDGAAAGASDVSTPRNALDDGEDGGAAEAPDQPLSERVDATTAERSPWPMVLFSGIALMVAAGLLRWILAPRAG